MNRYDRQNETENVSLRVTEWENPLTISENTKLKTTENCRWLKTKTSDPLGVVLDILPLISDVFLRV